MPTNPTNPTNLKRFLTDEASDIHPAVRGWLPEERIRANRRAEIEHDLSAERGLELVELDGDFAGHAAIAHPFTRQLPATSETSPTPGAALSLADSHCVTVEHRTFPLTTGDAVRALRDAMRARFSDCLEMRVYRRSGAGRDIEALAHEAGLPPGAVAHGRRLLAAPVASIQALPDPERIERVEAKPAENIDFYDEYAAHYLQARHERPEIAHAIPVESREAMRGYLAEGLLFRVLIDGRMGGVMAGKRTHFAGMHGYIVQEKFLYPEYRGQRLASAAQRRFVRALDASDQQLLFGFIHPRNVWSLKAAAKDGRVDVGGYSFFRLDDEAYDEPIVDRVARGD
ncbi:MAG: hypothetical protein EA376_06890 [Phycisphaeraceae bacterium]|nr:MAG: hypothetical protein EA376_06890 [Phycisphaeraceae bacterium]